MGLCANLSWLTCLSKRIVLYISKAKSQRGGDNLWYRSLLSYIRISKSKRNINIQDIIQHCSAYEKQSGYGNRPGKIPVYWIRLGIRTIRPSLVWCLFRLTGKLIPIRPDCDISTEEIHYLPCRCLCFGFFELFSSNQKVSNLVFFFTNKDHNKINLPYNVNSILSSDGLESEEEVVRTEDKCLRRAWCPLQK
jgi:hypothetical protein